MTGFGDGDVEEAVAGLACSSFHSLAVTSGGNVYAWGECKVRTTSCAGHATRSPHDCAAVCVELDRRGNWGWGWRRQRAGRGPQTWSLHAV